MLKIFMVFTGLLLLAVIYYNLFVIVPEPFILGIYPYVLGLSMTFVIALIILRFIKNSIAVNSIYTIVIIFFIFVAFTSIQIYKNSVLMNQYQEHRSGYLDELMRITEEKEY